MCAYVMYLCIYECPCAVYTIWLYESLDVYVSSYWGVQKTFLKPEMFILDPILSLFHSKEEDSCRACEKGPPAPVCGPNGINYRSICVAVNCSRIPPADLENGPCQSHVCGGGSGGGGGSGRGRGRGRGICSLRYIIWLHR